MKGYTTMATMIENSPSIYNFEAFDNLSHEEILEILIRHYNNCKDRRESIEEQLRVDSHSRRLKNEAKEHSRALTAITDLLDDLGIDVDEL